MKVETFYFKKPSTPKFHNQIQEFQVVITYLYNGNVQPLI